MICARCKKHKNDDEFDGRKACNECRSKRKVYATKWLEKLDELEIPVGYFRCNRCLVVKPNEDSNKGQSKCKDCESYCRSYYDQNKDQEIARALKSQEKMGRYKINEYKRQLSRKKPAAHLLRAARYRAKTKNLPFDLEIADIEIPEVCPVLGCKLKQGTKGDSNFSPSIDRIIPSKGYTKGNIRVISWRANNLRKDATLEELKKVVSYVESLNCEKNNDPA